MLNVQPSSHDSHMFPTPVAIVGLEETFYKVSEDESGVEVCAIVYSPNSSILCPINFAFGVSLSTISDDSAGDEY